MVTSVPTGSPESVIRRGTSIRSTDGLIEKAAGKSLGEAMRELLFARAGLQRTAVDDAAEVVPGRASGYGPDDKAPSGFDNASFISMTYPGAAAALRSTAEDFCRWSDALFGGRVLKPESLKVLITPVRLPDDQEVAE